MARADFLPLVMSGPDDALLFTKRPRADSDEEKEIEREIRRSVTYRDSVRFFNAFAARLRKCTTMDELVSVHHYSYNSKRRYLRKHREMLFALECLEDFLACKLTDSPWDPKPEKNEALRWLDSKLTSEALNAPGVKDEVEQHVARFTRGHRLVSGWEERQ